MKELEISKSSQVGKIIKSLEYIDFEENIKNVENVADFLVGVNETIEEKINNGKIIKSNIDRTLKPYRTAFEAIRKNTILYMKNHNIEKIDGIKCKSIIYYEEKKTKELVATKQMLVGRKYVNLCDLTFDKLVEMLEQKGVKIRTVTEEKETIVESNIRIMK